MRSVIGYPGVREAAMSSIETMTDEQFERHALEISGVNWCRWVARFSD